MPFQYLTGIRDIICEEYPSLLSKIEFEFDIKKLPVRVLRKLERFIKNTQSSSFQSKLARKTAGVQDPIGAQLSSQKQRTSPEVIDDSFQKLRPQSSTMHPSSQARAGDKQASNKKRDPDDEDGGEDGGSSFLTGTIF